MNAQIEVQEFEIDAQADWKIMYSHFKCVTRFSYRRKIRRAMRAVRREAALERIIARLKRRIEYLEADLKLAQQQAAESEERREFAARMEFGA